MDKYHITANLLEEIEKLHSRYELSKIVGPDYYEPGTMEFLDKSDGFYNAETGEVLLRFEVKGTRYEGRTELIENVHEGDTIEAVRDLGNTYNPNNFTFQDLHGNSLGNMPAELCNAVAPLYDEGLLSFQSIKVSYVEPVSKRSRHAKQAILFVEMRMDFHLR